MVAVRVLALALIVGLLVWSPSSGHAENSSPDHANHSGTTLFAQSAGEVLHRDFPDDHISFLLLDARTGAVLASRWDDPEAPIPLGSLVTPFAALAYAEQRECRYTAHTCRGTATGCWLPQGHGHIDLTSAIAYSCNSYFRALTADMTASEISPIANRFGLQAPAAEVSGAALAGLSNRWLISPLKMTRAYLE